MFLTPAQLEELTGYVQPAAQVRWLVKAGVRHYKRRDGRPVVTVAALEGHITPRLQAEDMPDFSALRRGEANHGKAAKV